jgi:hypothetical protein
MRRVLIFLLVGPPVGLLVAMLVSIPVLNVATGGPPNIDAMALVVLLPLAYALGAVPALLLCGMDASLAKLQVRARVALCGLAGFFAVFLPLPVSLAAWFWAVLHGRPSLEPLGVVGLQGLVGLTAAAVCSWLVGPLPRSAATS